MQQSQPDPTKPMDPTQPPSKQPAAVGGSPANAPAVVSKSAIPELGIAGGKSQDRASTSAPADRSTEFVPVEGGGETTSAEALLVAAYIVMWALLLAFVFRSWRRTQSIEVRVGELERALRPKDRPDATA